VGEEILHSIRFYTHGWDIFTPTQNVVFHEYTRATKPKIWTDNPYYIDVPAFDKVKYYLKLMDNVNVRDDLKYNLEKYGLGSVRSLEDYYKFAGIDLENKKVYKNFCRENNIATEDDILMSNEVNHKKGSTPSAGIIEGFENVLKNGNNRWDSEMYRVIILMGILLVFYIILNKKRR
jgi:hypothetical protein